MFLRFVKGIFVNSKQNFTMFQGKSFTLIFETGNWPMYS